MCERGGVTRAVAAFALGYAPALAVCVAGALPIVGGDDDLIIAVMIVGAASGAALVAFVVSVLVPWRGRTFCAPAGRLSAMLGVACAVVSWFAPTSAGSLLVASAFAAFTAFVAGAVVRVLGSPGTP